MILSELYGNILINNFCAEKFYAQNNDGAKLSNSRKLMTAQCLKNTAALMNESFINSSSATQRGNLGAFKKLTA